MTSCSRIAQHLEGAVPGGAGCGLVAGSVLRLPGEALAHDLDTSRGRGIARAHALARHAAPLDELDHAHWQPEPRQRMASPQAAVLLPLPLPVWTISSPFSIVLLA